MPLPPGEMARRKPGRRGLSAFPLSVTAVGGASSPKGRAKAFLTVHKTQVLSTWPAACQKSPWNKMSLRAGPQTGVAISRYLRIRYFRNICKCRLYREIAASGFALLAMTTFFSKQKRRPRLGAPLGYSLTAGAPGPGRDGSSPSASSAALRRRW